MKHEVDPLLLGSLYLVSKLCFFTFLGWTLKNIRAKKPIMLPLLFAGISFSIPYLYLSSRGVIFLFGLYVYCPGIHLRHILYLEKVTSKPDSLNI